MSRFASLHVAILAIALFFAPQALAQVQDQLADATPARISDRLLQALAEANGVPGMGASVVRDGEIVWTGSVGHRDLERRLRVDRHTRFRLASVSKVIAATAAAKLQEQGALDLDAPVQSTLPWLQAGWAPITPRQLAAHISGMPHYQAIDEARGGVHYASVRDAVDLLRDRQLLSPPGTRYHYSSWGYSLLSAVVEAGADMSFLHYLARDVVPGLAIGADATDGADPDASRAYEFVDGQVRRAAPHDYSYTWAGGGLAGTPEALAQFGARVLAGTVVAPDTLRWMLQATTLADGTPVRDRDYAVGFGWRVSHDPDGARIVHHAGVTNGARSALVLWPEYGLSASLLSNALWVSSIEQTTMMLAVPFQLADALASASAAVACPLRAMRYQGDFDGKPLSGDVRFVHEDGLCVGMLSVPEGPFATWVNAGPQRDVGQLTLVGFDPGGGLGRAALVTPLGLYDLRLGNGDLGHVARLGATSTLTLRWQ
ncbi:serine hydrolase domain-containing protein [Thermomonas carbonis]|uniref:Beta-lactamase family protein n=1 Tax=Thermomonas carbonis TaxID=1463158 RepID=A0A7G9SPI5_9GAMM|nr:serine hydrolase domain-containing protein [Thermomonas carbonis]QNN69760.1 beta-lactamase family protein [Thermomonas carbonis]GHB95325.1 hypothetical protein GCM10010080_03460 [Thermomonas carbonis]